MATVNLNKLASAMIGENTKVRIRLVDGALQMLPTNRVKSINLPKGETLVDLRVKKGAVNTFRFTLPKEMELQVSMMHRAVRGKHGWIALEAMSAEERAAALIVNGAGPKPAHASVSEK